MGFYSPCASPLWWDQCSSVEPACALVAWVHVLTVGGCAGCRWRPAPHSPAVQNHCPSPCPQLPGSRSLVCRDSVQQRVTGLIIQYNPVCLACYWWDVGLHELLCWDRGMYEGGCAPLWGYSPLRPPLRCRYSWLMASTRLVPITNLFLVLGCRLALTAVLRLTVKCKLSYGAVYSNRMTIEQTGPMARHLANGQAWWKRVYYWELDAFAAVQHDLLPLQGTSTKAAVAWGAWVRSELCLMVACRYHSAGGCGEEAKPIPTSLEMQSHIFAPVGLHTS